MFSFDVPTPTPSPITQAELSALIQSVIAATKTSQEYVTSTGIIGIIFALVVGILGIGALYTWTRRGHSAAQDGALTTIASAFTRSEAAREKQDARMDRMSESIRQLGTKHVEGLTAVADGMNRYADDARDTRRDINSINDSIHTIATTGSPTVQELATTIRRIDIEGTQPVKQILEQLKMINETLERMDKESLSRVNEQLKVIQQNTSDLIKHKTQPLPAITDPPPSA